LWNKEDKKAWIEFLLVFFIFCPLFFYFQHTLGSKIESVLIGKARPLSLSNIHWLLFLFIWRAIYTHLFAIIFFYWPALSPPRWPKFLVGVWINKPSSELDNIMMKGKVRFFKLGQTKIIWLGFPLFFALVWFATDIF
jgi:hypothetical protein